MQSPDKFKCKICKNAYTYEVTLKTHVMIVHCKIKSYLCCHCEYHKPEFDGIKKQTPKSASAKVYTLGGPLKNYLREKLQKCSQCDYASFRVSNLREH